jgi:hypothetical protein
MAFFGIIGIIISVVFIFTLFANIWREGFFGEKANLPRNRKGWW